MLTTLTSTQITVEKTVFHEEMQGFHDGLRRACRERRVARANGPMLVNIGTRSMVELLMFIPRPQFHGADLVRIAVTYKDQRRQWDVEDTFRRLHLPTPAGYVDGDARLAVLAPP